MPGKTFLQRNKGFGERNFGNGLNLFDDNLLEVFVVAGNDFDQQRILAGDMMTLDDFGNFPDFIENFVMRAGRGEIYLYPDKGTGEVPHVGRIKYQLRTGENTRLLHFTYALVNSGMRNLALTGNFDI